jgi:uncharacterized protein (TIGR03437 family)
LITSDNFALQDAYGQPDQNGLWPTTLAGFQVKIATTTTGIVAVTRIQTIPATYAVDFLVPDQAATGNQIPVTITHNQVTSWTTTANIQVTSPAFWSITGTADGPLLALDADLLITIDPNTSIRADNTRRVLLFASGIKTLVAQNTLTIRVTCESGHQALVVHDFAATLSSLSGIQQIVIRIPTELAGCGRTRFTIADQQDGDVFLLIQ